MKGVSPIKVHAGVFLLTLFPLARLSFSTPPENSPAAAEIVHKSVAANLADWKAQPEYAYRELDVKSKADSTGQTRSEQSRTYEVMMIEGSPYNRLIAIANEPLGRAQQQLEQIKLNAETARRQNESGRDREARIAKYQNERAEEHTLMQQMVAAFTFRLSGEEQIHGTDCYVLDAVPKPDYTPPVQRARVLKGMQGRLWIDKAHYHWVKVQAEVTSPVEFGLFIAKVKPGTRFELDQAPVGDVWLPKCFTETVNATVLGFYSMRSKEEDHYSDYHQTMLSARR